MVEKKPKPQRREAGQRRLQLPERQPRQPEENPMREILAQAKAEEATYPTPRTPPTPPAAPERDFARVANSIVREVVAGGYFVGKSKQLYDYLYSRTRGAIAPTKTITLPKPQLMKGAGIGSERTLLKNLKHLVSIGLVSVAYTDGRHEGNEYTVLLPEEVGLRTPPTPRTPRHARVELPPVPPVESGVRGVGSKPIESTSYSDPKTFIKDIEKTDDEAFAGFLASLAATAKELTGKEPSKVESEKWKELADVLMAELRMAAARTSVSSVPAFLAEHLRRRLWKIDKKQARAEGRELPDETEPSLEREESAGCPDCLGSGWWYPDGVERGVAKCKHSSLKREENKS